MALLSWPTAAVGETDSNSTILWIGATGFRAERNGQRVAHIGLVGMGPAPVALPDPLGPLRNNSKAMLNERLLLQCAVKLSRQDSYNGRVIIDPGRAENQPLSDECTELLPESGSQATALQSGELRNAL